jgi:hypothetical protein
MTVDAATVIAQWPAPAWADAHVIDEQAVIHSRSVGTFRRHRLDEEREVRLVQRDEFDEIGDIGSITRQPAYFVLDGDLIAVTDAPVLARLLLAGMAIIEDRDEACGPARAGHVGLPIRVLIPIRQWVESILAFLMMLGRQHR